jgi:hypothetical protein
MDPWFLSADLHFFAPKYIGTPIWPGKKYLSLRFQLEPNILNTIRDKISELNYDASVKSSSPPCYWSSGAIFGILH